MLADRADFEARPVVGVVAGPVAMLVVANPERLLGRAGSFEVVVRPLRHDGGDQESPGEHTTKPIQGTDLSNG